MKVWGRDERVGVGVVVKALCCWWDCVVGWVARVEIRASDVGNNGLALVVNLCTGLRRDVVLVVGVGCGNVVLLALEAFI